MLPSESFLIKRTRGHHWPPMVLPTYLPTQVFPTGSASWSPKPPGLHEFSGFPPLLEWPRDLPALAGLASLRQGWEV